MKTVKKFLILFAIIGIPVLVLCLSACGNSESNTAGKSLYTQGLEIIQLMNEAAQSEEYINIYTENSEIKSIVQNISAGDYSAPKAVYAISITDENLAASVYAISTTDENLAAIEELTSPDNPSEMLKSFLMQKIFSSVMTQINGLSSVENLIATSICTVSRCFVNENVNDNIIYLYTYDNAVPVAVTFIVGENHAVSASGVFILHDEFTCDSTDEIKSFFSDITVDVTEVRPEK